MLKLNKQQTTVLKEAGYTWAEIPDAKGPAKATYYHKDKETGEIIEHPNLPIDPWSLQRYLRRGFVLNKSQLQPQAVEQSQEGEFACKVCGKSFTAKIALLGHQRSHK